MGQMVLFSPTRRGQVFDLAFGEVKTYRFDWARRLASNPEDPADTITGSTFDLEGVTEVSDHFDDTTTTITVAATGETGRTYPVSNWITTADGQTDHWPVNFRIREP